MNFLCNPVESQKDFHVKRLAELGLLIPPTITPRTTLRTTPAPTTTSTVASIKVMVIERERPLTLAPLPEIVMNYLSCNFNLNHLYFFQTFHRPTAQEIETEIESNYIDNGSDNYIPSEPLEHDNKDEDEFYGGVTSEMLEMEVTTHQATTTTVETTTIPISELNIFTACYAFVQPDFNYNNLNSLRLPLTMKDIVSFSGHILSKRSTSQKEKVEG